VNDGSTDETPQICADFGDRIRTLVLPNGGVSQARNRGAAIARGDWLLFLDADDILLPGAVDALRAAAGRGGAGVAYGFVLERAASVLATRLTGLPYCVGSPPAPSMANLHRSAIITPGSAIVRRDIFEQAGGFTGGTEPMEDRDLWLRCGLLAPVVHCDAVVLDKTYREGSHGSQTAKRIYRGWLSKNSLRSWGEARGLDVRWIPNPNELINCAMKEVFYWKCWELITPLLEDASREGLGGSWLLRARIMRALLTAVGRLPSTPTWIADSAGRIKI